MIEHDPAVDVRNDPDDPAVDVRNDPDDPAVDVRNDPGCLIQIQLMC